MTDKENRYANLVEERRRCHDCEGKKVQAVALYAASDFPFVFLASGGPTGLIKHQRIGAFAG